MTLDPKWVETALMVTGNFETAGDPFAGITGDFDGQGLSCGVLQWNIGQGSLQPLVKAAGKPAVTAAMPSYGAKFWSAVTKTIPEGIAIVRAWQTNGTLKADVKAELAGFCGGAAMRTQQIAAARHVADVAHQGAAVWARDRGTAAPSKKEFCWFFDLTTQNGGLKGLSLKDVRGFIAQWGTQKADDAACDWLAARPSSQFGYKDCRKNAPLWRDKIASPDLDLFVLAYLRSLKCVTQSQGVVMNRKGAIALKKGWANGELVDLSKLLN